MHQVARIHAKCLGLMHQSRLLITQEAWVAAASIFQMAQVLRALIERITLLLHLFRLYLRVQVVVIRSHRARSGRSAASPDREYTDSFSLTKFICQLPRALRLGGGPVCVGGGASARHSVRDMAAYRSR
jgi:hypothetical protein